MKSDKRLRQDVQMAIDMATLDNDPARGAAQIAVTVEGGMVTLTGQVSAYADRIYAERAARQVAGVKGLSTKLHVTVPAASKRSDTDIARAAGHVLQWIPHWPGRSIRLVVEGGWITLSGALHQEDQRVAADRLLRHLIGVTGVTDLMSVEPELAYPAVQRRIATKSRWVARAAKRVVPLIPTAVTVAQANPMETALIRLERALKRKAPHTASNAVNLTGARSAA